MGASVGQATTPAVDKGPKMGINDPNIQKGPIVSRPSVGGKGGGVSTPAPAPSVTSPMAQPVTGPNVFQQAQQGLTGGMGAQQAAMMGAQREMNFAPLAVRGTSYNPATASFLGYNPATASSRGYNAATAGSRGYDASQAGSQGYSAAMGDQRIGSYMNPYESQVIGNLQQDVGRAMQMGANQLGSAASRAGAFGGSRHGIAQGQMMGDALRGLTSTAGQLRQQGFNTALQASQADAQRMSQASQFGASAANQAALANMAARNQAAQFGASAANQVALANQAARNQAGQFGASEANRAALANQAARNQASQFGAAAGNQARLSNQAAINQARQFGATQGMTAQQANQAAQLAASQQRLGASGALAGYGTNLANIGQMGFNMGRQLSQDSMQQGLIQQMLNQQLIDAAKGQYQGFTGAPRQAVADMVSAIAGSPSPTTTTSQRQLGLFDLLTAGAMFA